MLKNCQVRILSDDRIFFFGNSSDLSPIHFGRADGVECTLLRVACQSGTLATPPWQGDASIRVLWHIGCQGEFDELVSMSFRPVDCGFARTKRSKWLPIR